MAEVFLDGFRLVQQQRAVPGDTNDHLVELIDDVDALRAGPEHGGDKLSLDDEVEVLRRPGVALGGSICLGKVRGVRAGVFQFVNQPLPWNETVCQVRASRENRPPGEARSREQGPHQEEQNPRPGPSPGRPITGMHGFLPLHLATMSND